MHTTSAPPTDPRGRLLFSALIAAPVLLLGSTVAYGLDGGLGNGAAGGAVQTYAAAGLALAMVKLTSLLEPTHPRAAAVLTATGLLGAVAAAGFAVDAMTYAADPSVAPSEVQAPAHVIGLLLPGVIMPLTLATIGVLLARSGAVARRSALALVAGAILFPLSRIPGITPLALADDVLLLAALGSIGVAELGLGRRALAGVPSSTSAGAAGVPA